jgi:hypothetical protein
MPFGTQAKQKLCDAMIMDDENAEPEATTMSRANRMEAPIRREAEAIFRCPPVYTSFTRLTDSMTLLLVPKFGPPGLRPVGLRLGPS